MPPEMMMIVMPSAAIATTADCTRMFWAFLSVANRPPSACKLSATVKMPTTSTSAKNGPTTLRSQSPPRRAGVRTSSVASELMGSSGNGGSG